MAGFELNETVTVNKGVDTGKPGVVQKITYQVLVDGRDVTKPYSELSLTKLVVPPPPPPLVEFSSAVGGDGFVDYHVAIENPGSAHDVIVGLDPGADSLPKRVDPAAASVTGRLEDVPAGTYSVWAAVRDSTGRDLAVAVPLQVTVTAADPPPPPPPTGEQPRFDGAADNGFGDWSVQQGGIFGNSTITIEDSPVLAGHKAFRFWVDALSASNGPRAELLLDNIVSEGTTDYIGDVLYVPRQPNQTVGWEPKNHDLIQFGHPGAAAPPFRLNIRTGSYTPGLYMLGGGDKRLMLLDDLYDQLLELVFRVKWSRGSDGEIQTWVNGIDTGTQHGPTLATAVGHMKQGQYGESRGNVTLWHGLKIGPTYESVQR